MVTFFAALAAQVPESQDHEPACLALSEENLPIPPPTLATSSLCATWHYHFYNDSPVDLVSLEADKPTLRALALLILASIFHRRPERVTLLLEHPRATVRRLIVGHDWDEQPDYPGYAARPLRVVFYPTRVERHPWGHTALQPRDLPILYLTNEQEMVMGPEELPLRNVAVGFGSAEASALFAELLLNASLAANTEVEFELEGEQGFRGVGVGSAEIQLSLPGGLGYLDTVPDRANDDHDAM